MLHLAKTGRNIVVALLLSFSLTLLLGAFYTFYPVTSLILTYIWNWSTQQDSNGIAVVVCGVSGSFLKVLVIVAPILFLIIFALLQNRTVKN
jgi:hypothetical protein